MANLVIAGDVSGTVTLSAPAASGTTTLTLPTTSGTLIVNSGAQTIQFADGSAAAPSITNSGDTNTGMFFPAADTIAFAEGGTEQMRLTDTGLLQFNSGYGSVATAYGCRAWVHFNGQGTVAILGSGNVSSITDNGVGDYRINMTTAMPDGNYCVVSNAVASGSVDFQAPIKSFVNTSTFDIYTSNGTALTDPPGVFVTVFR
jgi:hypothetical protein